MIETKNEVSKNLEKALQELQRAKQHVANEKKKQNEKKRKAEVKCSPRLRGAHRYTTRGGMCAFYLPTKSISASHYTIGRM